ncbi:Modular serine protease [Eumeta japonica]|uniref:Modular serine protease n=1 Tax=Eumeta variegata TaxID=151549 RepID=A0A4C1V376_EUMVA|nr:Modular serine protease [Eumeta japonica]
MWPKNAQRRRTIERDLTGLSRHVCKLPAPIEHGNYTVVKQAKPDYNGNFGIIHLNFACDSGHSIVGASAIYCSNGTWSGDTPKCAKIDSKLTRFPVLEDCRLNRKIGVEYLCSDKGTDNERMRCNDRVIAGAVCGLKLPMTSRRLSRPSVGGGGGGGRGGGRGSGGDSWGAGTDPPRDVGRTPIDTDLPWHVGIYSKLENPYRQTCGGSIVAYNLVISAAHWNSVEGLQPASRFAVGAGKVYGPWDDPRDNKAQKSDVEQIIVPPRFWGAHTNFQDDIALVFLSTPLVFDRFMWPICLDFNELLEKSQLNAGTAVCRGDSGGGLAFFEGSPGDDRMRSYLRGIASTAPTNADLCNTFTITSFTKVSKHERFIKSQYGKVMRYPNVA